jgi:hypothetical protein
VRSITINLKSGDSITIQENEPGLGMYINPLGWVSISSTIMPIPYQKGSSIVIATVETFMATMFLCGVDMSDPKIVLAIETAFGVD